MRWYFAANRQATMPFAVLLEIALQPCGWLAAYLGSALTVKRRSFLPQSRRQGNAVLYPSARRRHAHDAGQDHESVALRRHDHSEFRFLCLRGKSEDLRGRRPTSVSSPRGAGQPGRHSRRRMFVPPRRSDGSIRIDRLSAGNVHFPATDARACSIPIETCTCRTAARTGSASFAAAKP